jgi:transcriptional regulator with XRE-family HTH domain
LRAFNLNLGYKPHVLYDSGKVYQVSFMTMHHVDKYVGGQLRKRRLLLRISQDQLAKQVALTFQQIQKYERGLNRISCSKLYEFAEYLKIDIGYFFQGLAGGYFNLCDCPTEGCHAAESSDCSTNKEQQEISKLSADINSLVTAFTKIKNAEVREHVLSLVQSLSQKASNQ